MQADVTFGLLGPLTVRVDGAAVPILPGKQRVLLATLLVHAGRTVTIGQLAKMVWGEAQPRKPTVTLHNYVMRLRRAMGPGRDVIETQPGGYLIHVGPGEFDVTVMEEALAAAHRSARAGAWPEAAAHASAALALWRGDPLCDIDSDRLTAAEIPRLTELRVQARELRLEAGLQLGGHAELVTEACQLAEQFPLREHPRVLLIHALHGCGRRADALAAYQDARRVLVKELGCEPGPELQAVHADILADHRTPVLGPPGPPPEAPVPQQLPAAVSGFSGRGAELAALNALLATPSAGSPRTMLITVVSGTAGVGKTALAVHWAHQVASRFPSGQLYVNLRGHDLDQPVSAADALAGFLQALGVPGQQIPDGCEDRARLYRSRLAGQRMLVVLDNARDSEHVRLLLPGDPGCAALVTSRDTLAGLVATEGARRLGLDLLPLEDAVTLLRSLIGDRADADLHAVAELAGLCARLPLALRIAAEQSASRPATPLAELAAELRSSLLDRLDAGDQRADVRAVFSWSFLQLPDDAAAAFALVGLHPGGDFDAHAVAALTGSTPAEARRALGRLHQASLLQPRSPTRYGMHDLLRTYAREQAAATNDDCQCQQALTRMFDYYVSAAAAAMDILFPAETQRRPRIAPSAAVVPDMPGEAAARAWLDRERANLVAVIVNCLDHGRTRRATRLTHTLHRYLIDGSHLPEADIIFGHTLHAARRFGDLAAEAGALHGLGSIRMKRGHFRDAADYYRAALERNRQCGNREGEAWVLQNLGMTEFQLHNHPAAADYYRQAIAAYQDAGDSRGVVIALCGLSNAETELGSYDQAAGHLQSVLRLSREAEDQPGEARALEGIGELNLRRGQLPEAADFFEQALALYRRTDNPAGVANGVFSLGEVSLRSGEYSRAIGYLEQAIALFRQARDQYGETLTLRTLAEALDRAGQPVGARAELTSALRLAAETGNTYQQASAHRDLAGNYHSAGDGEQARHHWQQALILYAELGSPEADQIRTCLGASG